MKTAVEALNDTRLTEEQKAVVTATEDLIRVKALAGTGKTFTAVQRVIYQKAIGNEVGHVFTFTTSARDTIKERLDKAGLEDVSVRTLHSYALEIVNKYREERGLEKITILQGQPGSQFIKDLYWKEYERSASAREVQEVRQMSTLLINGAAYAFRTSTSKEELEHLVKLYHEEKKARGQYDWDNLIAFAYLISKQSGQSIGGEIIIDEAQDLTTLQMEFVKNLKPERLTLILDPNQNIFGFAGVEQAAMKEPGFKNYKLSKSFRTAQNVLNLANQLIDDNLVSDIKGGKVTWITTKADEQTQAVLSMIKPGDAVISRFKASAREVQEQFDPELALKYQINSNMPVEDDFCGFGSIHWSKGQEWKRVFILNVIENGFSGLPMTEEEKRIMYVAITRAKEEVIVMNLTTKKPGWFNLE
jgi:ATP-dependent DNA helicase